MLILSKNANLIRELKVKLNSCLLVQIRNQIHLWTHIISRMIHTQLLGRQLA